MLAKRYAASIHSMCVRLVGSYSMGAESAHGHTTVLPHSRTALRYLPVVRIVSASFACKFAW